MPHQSRSQPQSEWPWGRLRRNDVPMSSGYDDNGGGDDNGGCAGGDESLQEVIDYIESMDDT